MAKELKKVKEVENNMLIEVTKRYVDKFSKTIIESGTKLEVSDERAKELIEVEKVAKKTTKQKAE